MITMLTAALIAAQPTATARCELEGVKAVDLVALRVAILDQVMNGTPRPASASATMADIEKKAADCDPAGPAAASIAAARIAASTVAEKLSADGVDMSKVEAELEKTERPVLEALLARKPDADGVEDLRKRVVGVVGDDASDETRRLLGAYTVNAARVTIGPAAAKPPVARPKPTAPVER